jgi:hypothetical protein
MNVEVKNGDAVLASSEKENESIFSIPLELFDAFRHFMKDPKPSGSITIHFKSGAVAGVETNTKRILK